MEAAKDEKVSRAKKKEDGERMWGRQYLSLGIKGECNEQYNEAGTSQRNMQTGDERSGFQSEPLGVSWLRKGEKVQRGRADRRGERGWAGGSILSLCISEFLYHPNISAPLPAVPPPHALNAPRLSGCCFDSWPVSVYG